MKFSLHKTTTQQLKDHDLLVIAAFNATKENKKAGGKKSGKQERLDFGTIAKDFDKQLSGHLIDEASDEGFLGDEGQSFITSTVGKAKQKAICLYGLGKTQKQSVDHFRRAGGEIFKIAQRKRIKSLGCIIPEESTVPFFDIVQAFAEGIHLASYQFARYLSKDKKENYLKDICLYLPTEPTADQKTALARATALCESVFLARDLINEGPMILNPERFAEHATAVAKETGLTCDILDEKRLKRERMNLILAVASAAQPFAPPRLVRLHYKPQKSAKLKIVLVGKGVTFDSGGLDIKTAEGMLDMKVDMSGAACVLGTMRAIAHLKPRVEVFGYMACVENGVGPNAYHPGDIVVSHKGLSVEINNTDAEGRLVLADAISYATERDKPDIIIDVATLTGACMIALGQKTSAIFTNDDHLHNAICAAGATAGESFWRMPLDPALRESLKSTVADMKNTGDRFGGAITAALFLQSFVEDSIRWAHLDIAGPATNIKSHAYLPIGGVGFGIRTLASLLMELED